MIPDFEETGLPTSGAGTGDGDQKGEQDGAPWHLPGGLEYPNQRPCEIGMPAGGSSPLEVEGNLYVYLIPSIFKEERDPDREELPRGPPLPAGSCFEGEPSRPEVSYFLPCNTLQCHVGERVSLNFYAEQHASSYLNMGRDNLTSRRIQKYEFRG